MGYITGNIHLGPSWDPIPLHLISTQIQMYTSRYMILFHRSVPVIQIFPSRSSLKEILVGLNLIKYRTSHTEYQINRTHTGPMPCLLWRSTTLKKYHIEEEPYWKRDTILKRYHFEAKPSWRSITLKKLLWRSTTLERYYIEEASYWRSIMYPDGILHPDGASEVSPWPVHPIIRKSIKVVSRPIWHPESSGSLHFIIPQLGVALQAKTVQRFRQHIFTTLKDHHHYY